MINIRLIKMKSSINKIFKKYEEALVCPIKKTTNSNWGSQTLGEAFLYFMWS